MLSDRLAELTEAGIIEREVIPGPPLRVTYRLTEKGRALGPGLLKLGKPVAIVADAIEALKTEDSDRTLAELRAGGATVIRSAEICGG